MYTNEPPAHRLRLVFHFGIAWRQRINESICCSGSHHADTWLPYWSWPDVGGVTGASLLPLLTLAPVPCPVPAPEPLTPVPALAAVPPDESTELMAASVGKFTRTGSSVLPSTRTMTRAVPERLAPTQRSPNSVDRVNAGVEVEPLTPSSTVRWLPGPKSAQLVASDVPDHESIVFAPEATCVLAAESDTLRRCAVAG
jgi:hypothetical protein